MAPDARVAETRFRVEGMHCGACAHIVEDALMKVRGVLDAHVSAAAHHGTVRWDVEQSSVGILLDAAARSGYRLVPDTTADARATRQREGRAAVWRLFVAGFCSMQVMMLAAPAYFAKAGELAPDIRQLFDASAWLLSIPVVLFSAAPFFASAVKSLRTHRLSMDVPVALGIVVAFVASSAATFDPAGPFGGDVYFDSLTMFVFFLLAGRYLETRARHRAAALLETSLDHWPEAVIRVLDEGRDEEIPRDAIRRGDTLRVPVGQVFAADGVLLSGPTDADESLLTGESVSVSKQVGDAVFAGSVNRGAPATMRVERQGSDTRYEAIVALVRESQTQRPRIVGTAERWAGPFLAAVLLSAVCAAAIWSVVDPARAVGVAIAVLIVTCPCALSLAAPSALLVASSAMARRGLLLRRLDALEGLSRLQVLYVDKTGTLTEARSDALRMQVLDIDGHAGGERSLREIAASLARWSSHPTARLLACASQRCIPWTGLIEVPGRGVEGRAPDGAVWRLGKFDWASGSSDASIARSGSCLSENGRARALFASTDRLRDDSREAVAALAHDGLSIAILSGDSDARVERVAAQLDVASFHGGLTPEDKLAYVIQAQRAGRIVGMLGDGINDAPVLARADVSIAMGEGASIARMQADAILLSNRLSDLVHARHLAKKTLRVIRQNLFWAVGYNAACVPLALIGWLPPWAAGLGMASSSLIVVLNSLRLAR